MQHIFHVQVEVVVVFVDKDSVCCEVEGALHVGGEVKDQDG